jgi:two-component system, NarL family, invasion response regulator UvrY
MLVLLIDSHPALIRGLTAFLMESVEKCEIMSSSDTGEMLPLFNSHNPNLIITEIDFRKGGGALSDIQNLLKQKPQANVIVYTSYCTSYLMTDLIEKGVKAVILKTDIHELITAVNKLASGSVWVPENHLIGDKSKDTDIDPFIILNDREFNFFMALANGISILELMEKYHLSRRMVNYIKSDIRKKLNVQDDIELTKIAIKYGHIKLNMESFRLKNLA